MTVLVAFSFYPATTVVPSSSRSSLSPALSLLRHQVFAGISSIDTPSSTRAELSWEVPRHQAIYRALPANCSVLSAFTSRTTCNPQWLHAFVCYQCVHHLTLRSWVYTEQPTSQPRYHRPEVTICRCDFRADLFAVHNPVPRIALCTLRLFPGASPSLDVYLVPTTR